MMKNEKNEKGFYWSDAQMEVFINQSIKCGYTPEQARERIENAARKYKTPRGWFLNGR